MSFLLWWTVRNIINRQYDEDRQNRHNGGYYSSFSYEEYAQESAKLAEEQKLRQKKDKRETLIVAGLFVGLVVGWFGYRTLPSEQRQKELKMNEVARQILPANPRTGYWSIVNNEDIRVRVKTNSRIVSAWTKRAENQYIPKYETWTHIDGYNLQLITSDGVRWNSEQWNPRYNWREDSFLNIYSGPDDDARILESIDIKIGQNKYRTVKIDTLPNGEQLQKKYESMLETIASQKK